MGPEVRRELRPNPAPTQPHLESILKPFNSLLDSYEPNSKKFTHLSQHNPLQPVEEFCPNLLVSLGLLYGFTQNKASSPHDTLHCSLTICILSRFEFMRPEITSVLLLAVSSAHDTEQAVSKCYRMNEEVNEPMNECALWVLSSPDQISPVPSTSPLWCGSWTPQHLLLDTIQHGSVPIQTQSSGIYLSNSLRWHEWCTIHSNRNFLHLE